MSAYTGSKVENLLLKYLPPEKQEALKLRLVLDLYYRAISNAPATRYPYLKEIMDEAIAEKKKALLFFIRIDSPSGALDPALGVLMGHAVALKIDLENKLIIYQDPQGYDIPQQLSEDLKKVFPDFSIRELRVPQQTRDNHTDCGPLVVENIIQLATGNDINGTSNIADIRSRHDKDFVSARTV